MRPLADHAALLRPRPVAAPRAAVAATSATVGGTALPSEHVAAVVQAAADLVGVPLAYLAPDPALLPAESLRFFSIDPDWVRALQRGMLSAGSPRILDDDELDAVLDQIAPAPSRPRTGLVLRSTLVSDRPGIVVRAWTGDVGPNQDPDDPAVGAHRVKVRRCEVIAPSLLLAVFERAPDLVMIEEPHGMIRLGVRRDAADARVVALRDDDGTLAGGTNNPVEVAVDFRGAAADGILDVTATAEALQAAIQDRPAARRAPDPTATSAAFALQLLAPPIRQRYRRGVS